VAKTAMTALNRFSESEILARKRKTSGWNMWLKRFIRWSPAGRHHHH